MRVLLGIDGSVSSDRARDLVAGMRWPEGTLIRAIAVLEHATELAGLPWMAPIVIDEVTIVGSRCGPFDQALAALADGRVQVGALVSERFELGRGLEALALARSKPVMKVLLDVS